MQFRQIVDSALDGVKNMARDEAILEAVGRGESPPTLRFYQWSPPTISLGYFQNYAEYEALAPPAGQRAVVRRQTGGGAILHDLELTYSLTVPIDHPFVAGNASRMYEHVHGIAAGVLRDLGVPVVEPWVARSGTPGRAEDASAITGCSQRGPFFCFERHGSVDLLAAGRKIMGSAQRRTTMAVLQHGSLILDSRYPQQQCATIAQFARCEIRDLTLELSRRITGMELDPSSLSTSESERADELEGKYAGEEWTRR